MVFHVVHRRKRQQNIRRHFPHDGAQPGQQVFLVKYFQVVAQRRMKHRADGSGGSLRFLQPDARDFRGIQDGRTAAAVGDVHVMQLAAGLLEPDQRAAHEYFNIIRMRGDGEDAFGHNISL